MVNEGIIKRLMSSIKCTVCGRHYAKDSIKILGQEENLWFLSISCSTCHIRCLVAAVIKENKVPELITDLTDKEREEFQNLDKLTGNDLLDMHTFLKDFDGDFSRLFSRKEG